MIEIYFALLSLSPLLLLGLVLLAIAELSVDSDDLVDQPDSILSSTTQTKMMEDMEQGKR